jgi:nucleoside phosphorylase
VLRDQSGSRRRQRVSLVLVVDPIKETLAARQWVEQEISARSLSPAFGRLTSGVIWTDNTGPDGTPIGGDDPGKIEAFIGDGLPLLRNHDPGLLVGRTLTAKTFVTPSGRRFVAAIFGFYTDDTLVTFATLGIDPIPVATSPNALEAPLPNWRLELACDPRDIEEVWLQEVALDSPLPVSRIELSHNSKDSLIELLRVGLPYMLLVWNPLVTTVATKAGEALYAGIHSWLRRLWTKVDGHSKSVVCIQSHQDSCNFYFIFRGGDSDKLAKSHEGLALAAAQATRLAANLRANGLVPTSLIYEYEGIGGRWHPSSLVLADGRLVSDSRLLVPVEHLSRGLSLGLTVDHEDPLVGLVNPQPPISTNTVEEPSVTLADIKGKVDFGILTIREDEFEAVLERFPPFASVRGRRVYNLHRFPLPKGGSYLVVLVRCIEQGNAEALDAARDLLEELAPQWLLVVGIAGAVPSDEFSLGDVVISTRITDFTVEAVLQDKDPEYAISGGPVHKDAAVLIANLPARKAELQGWNSATSIVAQRPTIEIDDENFYGDDEWKRRAHKALTHHKLRTAPLVKSGAIGSSDRLVKDTKILSTFLLKVARQVLAVEMESAGVYRAASGRHVPYVAIRGISDVVGFKRDPGWTAYACHSAASFTHALLRSRPIEPVRSAIETIEDSAVKTVSHNATFPKSGTVQLANAPSADVIEEVRRRLHSASEKENLLDRVTEALLQDLGACEVRRQFSGSQFGFDIWARIPNRDGEVELWNVQCKNPNRPITLDDVAPKLIWQSGPATIDRLVMVGIPSPSEGLTHFLESHYYSFPIALWTEDILFRMISGSKSALFTLGIEHPPLPQPAPDLIYLPSGPLSVDVTHSQSPPRQFAYFGLENSSLIKAFTSSEFKLDIFLGNRNNSDIIVNQIRCRTISHTEMGRIRVVIQTKAKGIFEPEKFTYCPSTTVSGEVDILNSKAIKIEGIALEALRIELAEETAPGIYQLQFITRAATLGGSQIVASPIFYLHVPSGIEDTLHLHTFGRHYDDPIERILDLPEQEWRRLVNLQALDRWLWIGPLPNETIQGASVPERWEIRAQNTPGSDDPNDDTTEKVVVLPGRIGEPIYNIADSAARVTGRWEPDRRLPAQLKRRQRQRTR